MDLSWQGGNVAANLPWIKKLAVDALVKDYKDDAEAHRGIRNAIVTFYQEKFPNVLKNQKPQVDGSIDAICAIYDRSVFPAMKVNWTTYTSNIGHRNWPGCFRCHDGNHVSQDGKVLSNKDCTLCHTMPQRGPMMPLGAAVPASKENWHPFELTGKHAEILCSRCHAAGFRPPIDCAECHKLNASAPMMDDCSNCHGQPGVKLPVADCKGCHDSLGGLHLKGGHPDASCTDCHQPHLWKVTARATCLQCHDDKKDHNAPQRCGDCHDFTG